MLIPTETSYIYDGSFEGFLCAVFEAYAAKEFPAAIGPEDNFQQRLGGKVKHIVTEEDKHARVYNGIRKTMGDEVLMKVWKAFLSGDAHKDDKLFRYIKRGFEVGSSVNMRFSEDAVMDVEKLNRHIGREQQHLLGFIHFSQMENGVYYAEFSPHNNALPLVMPHFADRFNSMIFMINDVRRRIAGIYDGREWHLISSQGLTLPKYSDNEREYRALWKQFYDSVAVQGRINPKLRRNLCPKRYWEHMVEMQPANSVKNLKNLFPAKTAKAIEKTAAG